MGGALVTAMILALVVPVVFSTYVGFIASIAHERMPGLWTARLAIWIIGIPLAAFFQAGALILSLRVLRGEPYSFGDIFSAGRYLAPAVGTVLLMNLAVYIGVLFLIVPGIIAATGLFLALPLVVDRNLKAIDALKESFRLTRGHKANIFVLILLLTLLSIAGACLCCIGLLAVIPLVQLTQAYVYLWITGQPLGPFARAA